MKRKMMGAAIAVLMLVLCFLASAPWNSFIESRCTEFSQLFWMAGIIALGGIILAGILIRRGERRKPRKSG